MRIGYWYCTFALAERLQKCKYSVELTSKWRQNDLKWWILVLTFMNAISSDHFYQSETWVMDFQAQRHILAASK